MNDETKSTAPSASGDASISAAAKKMSPWLPVLILCGVFLIGFVPMWLKSGHLKSELYRSQQQVRADQIQIAFANATLDARRGNYEPARQQLTKFFTLLTTEVDRGTGSALPAATAADVKAVLAQRDDLITLLARGDPASAERLANAYASFQKALNN